MNTENKPCLECGGSTAHRRKGVLYCSKACKNRAVQRRYDKTVGARDVRLKRTYGISAEAWETMFEAQGKRCANKGCQATEPGGRGYWHTDHDHTTGEVRGILCHPCNLLLGLAYDDRERLLGAIQYLETH